MKKLGRAFCIAFSMYSVIPAPHCEWDEESLRYAFCFFPLVGAATGAVLLLWGWLAEKLQAGNALFAAGAMLVTFGIQGGIHFDGFCDTADALASHQTRERKLEILKDSHIGAFALIGCGMILFLWFGLWSELAPERNALVVIALGFILSRALSGAAAVTFRSAKRGGTLAAFSDAAEKRAALAVLLLTAGGAGAAMLAWSPGAGGCALLAAALSFGYYRWMSYREFGGITGDLAGYFLTVCECAVLAGTVLGQKLF